MSEKVDRPAGIPEPGEPCPECFMPFPYLGMWDDVEADDAEA